jgi:hypothetical protein
MEQAALLIPTTGLMEVYQFGKVNVRRVLEARGDTGTFLSLHVTQNDDHVARVEWLVNQVGPLNGRAREALVLLCGTHMIFTGTVFFLDMDVAKAMEVVATLSRKD